MRRQTSRTNVVDQHEGDLQKDQLGRTSQKAGLVPSRKSPVLRELTVSQFIIGLTL